MVYLSGKFKIMFLKKGKIMKKTKLVVFIGFLAFMSTGALSIDVENPISCVQREMGCAR